MYLYHIVENIGKDLYLEIGKVKRYCNIYMIPANVSHCTVHGTCIVAPRNVVLLIAYCTDLYKMLYHYCEQYYVTMYS